MACACKVQKDIDYIYKKYGVDKYKEIKIKRGKRVRRKHTSINNMIISFFAWLCVILILPILISYIVINLCKKEKSVSIFKFLRMLGLSKNNGKQQIIQN